MKFEDILPAMFPQMGSSYSTLLCLLMVYLSPLMPTLAQSCPKQCSCSNENIECILPNFPIVLPSQKIFSLVISGSFYSLPQKAVVQPAGCNITNMLIYSSNISDVKPYCLSGLRAETVHLRLVKIFKLQTKAFAGITCKRFLITSSTINVLQMSSFRQLNSEELIISASNLPFVSLKPSSEIAVNRIFISKCDICELDAHFPIGNESITINLNKIQSIYENATLGGEFLNNKISCYCNLTSDGWFTNVKNKNYLFNNTCLDPTDLKGLPLVDLKQSDFCNKTKHATLQCRVHIIPKNSAEKFFKLNQTLVFFLYFLLKNSVYPL